MKKSNFSLFLLDGLASGEINSEFRLRRTSEGYEIRIGTPEVACPGWSTTVIGSSLKETLDRFKKIILMAAAECSMPTHGES